MTEGSIGKKAGAAFLSFDGIEKEYKIIKFFDKDDIRRDEYGTKEFIRVFSRTETTGVNGKDSGNIGSIEAVAGTGFDGYSADGKGL